MTTYPSMQQIQDLFSFPFRDPHWKRKLGIACMLVLASQTIILWPVSIFFTGYVYRIMKRIIVEKGEPFLPEWGDWKHIFKDGLRLFIPQLILSLPIILIFSLTFGAILIGTYKLSLSTPDNPIADSTQPLFPIMSIFVFLIFFGGIILYTIGLGLIIPVIMSHIVANDQVTAIFRIREWVQIYKANFPGFILAFIFPTIAMSILSLSINVLIYTIILSWLLPVLLAIITVIINLMSYSLYAQAYAMGVQRLSQE